MTVLLFPLFMSSHKQCLLGLHWTVTGTRDDSILGEAAKEMSTWGVQYELHVYTPLMSQRGWTLGWC